MSTCNFVSQDGFSLYAFDSDYFENIDDERWYISEVIDRLERVNEYLKDAAMPYDAPYSIEVKAGYYTGYQLYVHGAGDESGYIESLMYDAGLDEDDARKVLDENAAECRRQLKGIADNFGFDCYRVSARFSNGETWYERVNA